jgi:hypothetical protein
MEGLYKYQRTFHFLFSAGITSDDKIQIDYSALIGKRVIVSEKMDGECTTVYKDYSHARSLDSNNHESRNTVKGYWGERQYLIPDGWRVCGENLYAQHSIIYNNLEEYFYCFNIWNEKNECLSYDETKEWCELLNIIHVPVLYDGIFDYELFKKMFKDLDTEKKEGFVVRLADSFHYDDFSNNVVKAVRANHVQTDEHWLNQPIIPNKLKRNYDNSDKE